MTRAVEAPRTSLVVILGAVVVALCIATAVLCKRSVDTARAAIERSTAGIVELRATMRRLIDVEAAQRGYLLTRQRRFLEPYESGRREIAATMPRLEGLLDPEGGQHARLAEFAGHVERRLDELARTLEFDAQGRREAAIQQMIAGFDKGRRDEMRALTDAIESAERERLEASRRSLGRHEALGWGIAVGAPALALVGMLMGVGRLRRVARGRVVAERALHESESRLRLALDAANAGAWEWRPSTGEISWSPTSSALYGRSGGMGPVARDEWRRRTPTEDLARVDAALSDVLEGRSELFRVEYRWRHEGLERWLLALGRADPLAGGDRLVGITVDITDQKRAQHALEANDRLKDHFVTTLGHELRNPLAPVLNGLRLLGLNLSPADAEKTREMMRRQLAHLVRLVDDLLDMGRVRSGKIELRRAPLDLRGVIRSAVEIAKPMADVSSQRLHVELPDEPVPVEGDATRLVQVFGNLLNNAVKFSPVGGDIRIEVARVAPHEVRVRIRDSGPGIPADSASAIFEPFVQLESPRSGGTGGLGLGLAVARELTELHGGDIWVEPTPAGERGAEFHVVLPQLQAQPAAHGEPLAPVAR